MSSNTGIARVVFKGMIGAAALALSATTSAQATFDLVLVRGGFEKPTEVVGHPTDPGLVYVLEKAGRIFAVPVPSANGGVIPIDETLVGTPAPPLLDLNLEVDSIPSEAGLMGLAFHPDFASNRRFFVKYTEIPEDPEDRTDFGNLVIYEYKMENGTALRVNQSFTRILIFCEPRLTPGLHIGGGIHFGPDGMLWAPLGDGGDKTKAQDLSSPWGKILRFDVDVDQGRQASCGTARFYIPGDNPGLLGWNEYVWSYGVRNPYGWSFDSSNGDLWFGDVGWNSYEEINYQVAPSPGGQNSGEQDYGWDNCEGLDLLNCPLIEQPIHCYTHNNGPGTGHAQFCNAVIGGIVYQGSDVPSMVGRYIFGDYCQGALCGSPSWSHQDPEVIQSFHPTDLAGTLTSHGVPITPRIRGVVAFGEGADGELYVLDFHEICENGGRLYKMVP